MSQRILITRSLHRSQELVRRLEESGLVVTALAVTEPHYYTELLPPLPLSRVDWLAFTSVHGVHAFSSWLKRSGDILPACCQIAAVGAVTAAVAERELRRVPALISDPPSGHVLARALRQVAQMGEHTILYPCAVETSGEFEAELEHSTLRCLRWPVYVTCAANSDQLSRLFTETSHWDAVVFYAPSAVKSLLSVIPAPWNFSSITVGETTARAARDAGNQNVVVAGSPNPADMAMTIFAALNVIAPASKPLKVL
jgi:uroporphyrinogen-III synthase